MANPVWGAASSLSEEDMARTLCAFRYTSEPLSTQFHRPLRSQQQHQQPCNELNHEMSQLNGLPTIGCPSNEMYYMKPMLTQRDEAVSMMVDMNAPSTSSDNWHRQQQCAIQEQLEQQRVLRMQINQQQHQQEKHMQQQHMEVQNWQQEQVQNWQQEQVQQVQAQRLVERVLQPRYSNGTGGLVQTGWTNEVYTLREFTPSFCSGGNLKTAMQQPGQLYNARVGCSEQLPVRTTTAPIPTHLYMLDYRNNLQSGVSMDRNDDAFALNQDLQIVDAHLQARIPKNLAISAVHRRERHTVRLLAGIQPKRTKVSLMQTLERYIQQEPLQPQPYYPAQINQRSRQVIGTLGQASRSSLDDAFLDGIMEHFSTSAAPAVSNPTIVNTSAGFNVFLGTARENKAIFNANPAQLWIRTEAEAQIEGQINVHSRPPIPPSGAAVVPGVSLERQVERLVTMRDILNCEDGFSKVDSSTNQPHGGKQKRVPPTRKMLRKKTLAKRQKMSQHQSVRNFQQLSTNQPAGALLPGESAYDVTASAFISTTRPCTPMHLAFLESRAARASEQAAGIMSTNPSIVAISTSRSRSLLPAPVAQLSTEFANSNIAAFEGPSPVKSMMAVTSTGMSNSFTTCQSIQQHTRTPPQDTARLEQAMNDVQLAYFSHSSTLEAKQKSNESNALPTGQTNGDSVCDSPMDTTFGQHRWQQSSPEVSVSSKAANSIQFPIKLDVVENRTDAKIPKKISRAERPLSRVIPLTACGQEQQVHGTLPSAEGVNTRTGLVAATAVALATVKHTPVVSELPRMENRTVVIFCKRDFMRYQAVKIWRKYQEQLKKHEEWREIRVAGKRTRYLNYRYDGEIRRAERKAHSAGQATKKTISGGRVNPQL